MRLFEILLLVFLALCILRMIVRLRGPRWVDLSAAILLALIFILHLALEGLRWQMVPAYLLALTWFGILLWRTFRPPSALRRWPGWVMLPLLVLFTLLPVFFPVPALPKPSGPYAVGSQIFYWVDEARPDPFVGGPRKLMVQVWYPAAPGSSEPLASYLDRVDIGGPVLARQFKLPEFAFSHIALARTNGHLNAAPASPGERFPVLFFSHGWTGIRGQNTYQIEELASQGYIIFSADHTYGAALTVFPDGSVALNLPRLLPSNVSDEEYDKSARIVGQAFVADLRFLMDQAAKVDSGILPSALAGKLDLAKIGVFGHSTGAGATVETCYVDQRCKAGLTMDAWLIPYDRQIPEKGLKQPFLFMQSEKWLARRNPPLQNALYEHSQGTDYRMTIAGTSHYDFSDIPLFTPLASIIGLKGPISANRQIEIVNAYSVAFFNATLKGKSFELASQNAARFPEIYLEGKP